MGRMWNGGLPEPLPGMVIIVIYSNIRVIWKPWSGYGMILIPNQN
jgi:hypothetical protein